MHLLHTVFVLLPLMLGLPFVGRSLPQTDERPMLLVWSRDVPQTLHYRYQLAWSFLAPDYQIRFLEAFPETLANGCEPRRLIAADLQDVDVLVLSDWDGAFSCGSGDVNVNLSADEIATVERFVASGGQLLVVALSVGRSHEDNLPELLQRFDLTYAHTTAGPSLEQPQEVLVQLGQRSYTLGLSGALFAIDGGRPILPYGERAVVATPGHGQGKVAFLGIPRMISDDLPHAAYDWTRLLYPPAILLADNAAFFSDLLADLSGQSAPTDAELSERLVRARYQGLAFAFSGGTTQHGAPLPGEQADPAYIRSLRDGYDRGARCDAGPKCTPFAWTAEDGRMLAAAQQAEDRAWDAFARMRGLLDRPTPDYRKAMQAHDEASAAMNHAFALVAPIRARPVEVPSEDVKAWLWGSSLALSVLGLCIWLFRKAR